MEREKLLMTDQEFDLLDELYFVQPYDYLKEELAWSDEELYQTLVGLHQKGWLKCYNKMDEEVYEANVDLKTNYQSYFYLASKKGLMAHNGRA